MNSRNGRRTKTVLADAGAVAIQVPRDRDGALRALDREEAPAPSGWR
ncbi:transposase [Streptomyces sp. JCM17656]|nr:transposase [Streptomyces sp. JCM17656]